MDIERLRVEPWKWHLKWHNLRFFKVKGEWWMSLEDICSVFNLNLFEARKSSEGHVMLLKFLEDYPFGQEGHWVISEEGLSIILSPSEFKDLRPLFKNVEGYYSRIIRDETIELWDITQAWDLGRNEAQAVQYILRAKYKGQEKSDLKKAIDFLRRALEEMEED